MRPTTRQSATKSEPATDKHNEHHRGDTHEHDLLRLRHPAVRGRGALRRGHLPVVEQRPWPRGQAHRGAAAGAVGGRTCQRRAVVDPEEAHAGRLAALAEVAHERAPRGRAGPVAGAIRQHLVGGATAGLLRDGGAVHGGTDSAVADPGTAGARRRGAGRPAASAACDAPARQADQADGGTAG
ncbi:hypothetical protein D3C72_1589400 [compost metagenome]